MYDISALYEAESVPHAVELLLAHPEAGVLAGGSDILIQIREGRRAGGAFVSIYGLDELRGVSLDPNGDLRILPLTSFSHITRHPLIQQLIPVLGEAVDQVGGPQIRNIGTIGGNICNGVTSADSASTLRAWDAVLEITGPQGVRKLPITDFNLGPGKVDLRPAELLTAIVIPKESYTGCFGYYIKYAMRGAMDIATTGCSVNVRLSPDKGTVECARIAFGVAAPIPTRAPSAEAAAKGAPVSPETAEHFAAAAMADIQPRTSWRAKKEFREHIAREMAKRAFTQAVRRAGGEL